MQGERESDLRSFGILRSLDG